MKRDCKDCVNCDSLRGFMVTCHYSYNEDRYHVQVGQDVHRSKAKKCDFYTQESYNRDEFFVL